MSKAKARQIKELAQIPMGERPDAVEYETPLHREASGFVSFVHNGLWLKANPSTVPSGLKKWIKYHHDGAVKMFTRYFLDAHRRRNGKFFRALADVLEGENPKWSKRERYIYAQCWIASEQKEPLPTASQLLRGWRMGCGIIPERQDDLRLLWRFLYHNTPMPKTRAEIVGALRPFMGNPNLAAAEVQIVQIQREAANMGLNLPKQSRRKCLPAGFDVIP